MDEAAHNYSLTYTVQRRRVGRPQGPGDGSGLLWLFVARRLTLHFY